MAQNWSGWCWQLRLAISLAIGGAIANSCDCAFAQLNIIPDNSLGTTEKSKVTPDLLNRQVDHIEGGAIRGANLFHSFSEFNVRQGRAVDFANPAGVKNILSRVTGNDSSDILGRLGVSGNANLFLINPNGIIFGPNASLDVRGSFVASTASRLNFADGNQFNATAHPTTPLLTVSVPIGLQFGGTRKPGCGGLCRPQNWRGPLWGLGGTAGSIRVQGSGLSVQPGKTLALVGGNVTLEGGALAASGEPNLAAKGGRIELGSVAAVGEVSLNQRGNSWVLGYDQVDAFGDIKLEDEAFVDASGSGGGDIQIQSDQLDLTEGSYIFADTEGTEAGGEVFVHTTGAITLSDGSLITADVYGSGTGGDLTIAAGAIALSDDSSITADVLKTGTGTGGNLTIETGQLSIRGNRSSVSASTYGQGKGGNLAVNASDFVQLIGTSANDDVRSGLFVRTAATGSAGDLTIKTGRLIVQDESQVVNSTLGKGQGGNLSVTAEESVKLVGANSGLFTQTQGARDAGNLTIATRRLSVHNGAQVVNGTYGQGKGGNLAVTDAESVELRGTGTLPNGRQISSGLLTQTNGAGSAGELTIATRQLSVQDGAQVSSGTRGPGQGGNLTVTALESVELMKTAPDEQLPSALFTQTEGTGDAGNLTITTRRLIVGDGAQVSAATFGQGNGGKLQVNASNSVNIFGVGLNRSPSGLFTRTSTGGGQAGNITVDTSAFRIADGAIVDARTLTAGNGGNIMVKADTFEAVNGGQLFASAFRDSSGRAGNITVNTTDSVSISGSAPTSRRVRIGGELFIEDEPATSGLFVRSQGSGNAGELQVQARSIRLENLGEITAQTASGQGGDIKLQTQDLLLLRRGSKISTTAGAGGNGGNITINTPFIVAVPSENSDITANASQGKGGFIQITAQGVFGIERREQLTQLSDITAFSQQNPELNGVVEINTPDVDPNRGLVNLPAQLVDVTGLIAQGCPVGGGNVGRESSEFIVTGRGGLPPQPSEALRTSAVAINGGTLEAGVENRSAGVTSTPVTHLTPAPLVEAQGWVINAQGQVVLTASAPSVTPNSSKSTAPHCHAS